MTACTRTASSTSCITNDVVLVLDHHQYHHHHHHHHHHHIVQLVRRADLAGFRWARGATEHDGRGVRGRAVTEIAAEEVGRR